MPLSALYEARLHHRGRKSEPGMHRGPGRPRTHSPATRRGRGGGPSSSTATTPRAIASLLSSTNGSASARRREGSADAPSGSESLMEGVTGADKPQRKPKKKGWKGWAMVYYDDDGNVLEERMRDETPPEDRSTLSPAPELRVSRGADDTL